MTPLGDWMVFGVPAVEFTKRVVTRVPGGYLNRWLVRKVDYVPDRSHILMDKQLKHIYAHPALVAEIRAALPRRDGFRC